LSSASIVNAILGIVGLDWATEAAADTIEPLPERLWQHGGRCTLAGRSPKKGTWRSARMHAVEMLEQSLEIARLAGYTIRQEWLGESQGGACVIKGKKFLFLDP